LDSLVLASWRLRRCRRYEAAVLTKKVHDAGEAHDRQAQSEAEALGRRLLGGPADGQPCPPEDDPEALLEQLRSTAGGAAWLRTRWGELKEQLARYGCWDVTALATATLLLGGRPDLAAADPNATHLFAAVLAAHPDPRRLCDEWAAAHR